MPSYKRRREHRSTLKNGQWASFKLNNANHTSPPQLPNPFHWRVIARKIQDRPPRPFSMARLLDPLRASPYRTMPPQPQEKFHWIYQTMSAVMDSTEPILRLTLAEPRLLHWHWNICHSKRMIHPPMILGDHLVHPLVILNPPSILQSGLYFLVSLALIQEWDFIPPHFLRWV